MQVIVLANERQKAELAAQPVEGLVWIEKEEDFLRFASADAFIDLGYDSSPARKALLLQLQPKTVVINAVVDTLQGLPSSFVRINGWPGFLSSSLLEAACSRKEEKAKAEAVFILLGRQLVWLPDEPGFVTARVVGMIVNEAYLALAEGVSTKEEIDTAMKLGTNYPYGPFEWAGKIGLPQIAALLQTLGNKEARYRPAALLMQEVGGIS